MVAVIDPLATEEVDRSPHIVDRSDAFVISGTVDECRSELTALVTAHGIDEFQVSVNDLIDSAAEDLRTQTEDLARG